MGSEYFKIFQKSPTTFNPTNIRFKQQFKSLNFYSIPDSTLWIVKKRLNLIFVALFWLLIVVFSIL